MSSSESIYEFPKQKLPESKKTKAWAIKNIKAGVELLNFDNASGVRESRKNKIINLNLANNILSKEEMERVINPYNIKGFDFPDELQNFPLANPKIDLLVGEGIKRLFNPIVLAVNHDVISEKEEKYKNAYLEFVAESIQNNYPEDIAKQKLQELSYKSKWSSQDLRERMAQQIIEYHSKYQRWDNIFERTLKELLIIGEEVVRPTIIAGEPVLERLNPIDVITLRMGDSNKHEDSDIIVVYRRLPLGKVQDEFYEYLTEDEVSKLESGFNNSKKASSLFIRSQSKNPDTSVYSEELDKLSFDSILNGDNITDVFGGAYDTEGNLKVITVYWKSKRKIGIKTYFNELGEIVKEPVTEYYEPDEGLGEKVNWYWVEEWWEGNQLGDDIFTKIEPYVVNRYGIDNFVLKSSPIVGTIANIGSMKSLSLMDRMKPYQYLYNSYMHNLRKIFRNSRGRVPIIDTAFIPSGWTMDQYMYYLQEMNVMFVDSFKEGSVGAARGKVAGAMSGQQRELNLEMGSTIQQYLLMLNFLKTMIGEISGVTDQRLGQIEQRELVGNVERAVTQSSHITEEWFSLHEDFKLRAYTQFLEVAKEAYRGRKIKRSYILDDLSSVILDIDGDMLNEADYGIFIENSIDANNIMNNIKQLTTVAFQKDKVALSAAMDLMRIKSPGVMAAKFKELENEAMQRQQQAINAANEAEKAKFEEEIKLKSEELRIKEEDNKRKDETERYKIDATLNNKNETNDNDVDDDIKEKTLELKNKQIEETIRHNKATEAIAAKAKETSQKK